MNMTMGHTRYRPHMSCVTHCHMVTLVPVLVLAWCHSCQILLSLRVMRPKTSLILSQYKYYNLSIDLICRYRDIWMQILRITRHTSDMRITLDIMLAIILPSECSKLHDELCPLLSDHLLRGLYRPFVFCHPCLLNFPQSLCEPEHKW